MYKYGHGSFLSPPYFQSPTTNTTDGPTIRTAEPTPTETIGPTLNQTIGPTLSPSIVSEILDYCFGCI
jgi:hypothetical protein